MNPRPSPWPLLLLLAALAVFVWVTSAALPAVVASHFAASGLADGFMPRGAYRALMLAMGIGAPLLVGLLPAVLVKGDGRKLNLPHRDYWLAPERREETIAFLRAHGLWFGAAVAVFLAYVHWLVVMANRLQPPVLSSPAIEAGLAVFFLALAAWIAVLFRRFRRPA